MKISNWLTINNKADRTVEIEIDGYIGFDWSQPGDKQNTKERMKSELKTIADIKADRIVVNINSPGGDISHGLSIHDLLAANRAEIVTNVTGMSASAATVIAQAGDIRKISDNALYLVHETWTFAMGNSKDFEAVIDDLKKVNDRILNLYTKRAGKTEKNIAELMNENNGKGKWLSGAEAKEYGLVDEVYEPMEAAASASVLPDISAFINQFPVLPAKYKKDLENNSNNSNKTKGEKMDEFTKKLKAMTDMFGAEFANKCMLDGKSIEDAKTEFITGQKTVNADLNTQIETLNSEKSVLEAANSSLQAKINSFDDGESPLKIDNGKTGPLKAETFQDKLSAFEAEGLSTAKAVKKAAKEFPELHKEYLKKANS